MRVEGGRNVAKVQGSFAVKGTKKVKSVPFKALLFH